jgi:hypothetical protein
MGKHWPLPLRGVELELYEARKAEIFGRRDAGTATPVKREKRPKCAWEFVPTRHAVMSLYVRGMGYVDIRPRDKL